MSMRVGKIFMCQPGYGVGHRDSYRAFDVGPSTKYNGQLIGAVGGTSLLGYTFNGYWTQALNMQEDGYDITHFAMLHDDVVPEKNWLDMLLDDLEQSGADLMAGVIAIKDFYGLTSTAIDDPTDPFQVERRLALAELEALPRTFTAADCGYPDRMLLANTGCWVCHFDRDWRTKVRFTINDRVRYIADRPKGKRWVVEVDSEDWNFSRQVQSLGGKVACTKGIRIQHFGKVPFDNTGDWGAWQYDAAFGDKFSHKAIGGVQSPVPQTEVPKGVDARDSANVPGWDPIALGA